jgi:phosphonate transport system substrate-binding protein
MLFRICAMLVLAVACTSPHREGKLPLATPAAPPPPAVATLRLAAVDLPEGVTRLRLGVTPYLDKATLTAQLRPVVDHVAQASGLPTELVLADSYADLVERVARREVELSLLSPLSYVEAKRREPNLQLIAQTLSYGAPKYSSFVVVRAADPAEQLSDLRGRRIAWVDPLSASGYLFPAVAFLRAGLVPGKDLQGTFAGTHTTALRLLHEHKVDAAAISSGTLAEDQSGAAAEVKILATTGRIPYDAVCARGDMPRTGAAKLAALFQRIDTRTAQGRAILAKVPGISGWYGSSDAEYDDVRTAVRDLSRYQPQLEEVRRGLGELDRGREAR